MPVGNREPNEIFRVDELKDPDDNIIGVRIVLWNGVYLTFDSESFGLIAFGNDGVFDLVDRTDKTKMKEVEEMEVYGKPVAPLPLDFTMIVLRMDEHPQT